MNWENQLKELPTSPKVIELANQILECTPNPFSLNPLLNGGITLEWTNSYNFLEIDIDGNTLDYSYLFGLHYNNDDWEAENGIQNINTIINLVNSKFAIYNS